MKNLTGHITILLLLGTAAPLAAADVDSSAGKLVTPSTDRAIDRGLKWLVAGQHDDGSFGTGPTRGNVALGALSGMAMMSNGSTPGRGPYGDAMNRCVDVLLANAQPSGFIVGPDDSRGPMYGHGFATMFLAECYGMSPRADLREKLARAVKIIVNSQNREGGWRYQPVRADADVSVTSCQMMALRAARNAGLHVPNETIDRAIDYIRRSQNADGGFMYMIHVDEKSAFPRSAAALSALYSAGVYNDPIMAKGLDYLTGFLPNGGDVSRESYYYYGQYYAAQVMWQAGGHPWTRWYSAARDDLIARQQSNGAWLDPIGNEVATAMALIVLQLPNNYLPIFQR